MSWPVRRIFDWEHLTALFDERASKPGGATFAFRGQPDSSWFLRPSFTRECIDWNVAACDAIEIEARATEDFQHQSNLHLNPNLFHGLVSRKSPLGWWTIMQHHGAPTRLLDWTLSPFVATYFAVEDLSNKEGAVWCFYINGLLQNMEQQYSKRLTPETLGRLEDFNDPAGPKSLMLFKHHLPSDRMIAQQGIFTVSQQVSADHGDIVHDAVPEINLHTKILIPAKVKVEFLWRLRQMNITASALFPGVDGLGRSIRERVRSRLSNPSKMSEPPERPLVLAFPAELARPADLCAGDDDAAHNPSEVFTFKYIADGDVDGRVVPPECQDGVAGV
jgi:hypothetical protein